MRHSWILLAAGASTRFGSGSSKLLAEISGRRIIDITMQSMAEALPDAPIILVSSPEFRDELNLPCSWTAGGERRRDSALAGLRKSETEIALIHDAARPFVSGELVTRLLEAIESSDAVAPGLPVTDTIKRVKANTVTETLERRELIAVQTPQAVRREAALLAFEKVPGGTDFTDDLAVLSAAGFSASWIPGDPRNIKITTRDDLVLAERIAAKWPS